MIEAKHLTKKFGDVVAVDDLNLFIARGRIVFSPLG
jgi:ABC-type Na+ transport system ATPase subunit NatA